MEYITLPGTELKVSRICLGTMQFSNSWEWPCTQAQATAVVDAAMASGVNFFDTAQAYQVDGDRCSEKMLGIALGERRSEVVIASKFGLHAGEDQTVCDAAAVTQAIDDTLAALGTDYLDLMQIHWPGNIGYLGEQQADWLDAKEIVAALEAAVGAGKLKYYGLCNFGTGAKNASYLVRCHTNWQFYQDRLGTNTGKSLKKRGVFLQRTSLRLSPRAESLSQTSCRTIFYFARLNRGSCLPASTRAWGC
jgi:aryl-alcohol dehydrogenase-like predicted oxidoreductase